MKRSKPSLIKPFLHKKLLSLGYFLVAISTPFVINGQTNDLMIVEFMGQPRK